MTALDTHTSEKKYGSKSSGPFPIIRISSPQGQWAWKRKGKGQHAKCTAEDYPSNECPSCHRGIDGRSRTQMYASPAIEETRVRENTSALSAENSLTHGPLNKISCASVHLRFGPSYKESAGRPNTLLPGVVAKRTLSCSCFHHVAA